MELVDIFDANGNPTGMVRDRKAPLREGEYHLAVGAWVMDPEGNILLTKRSMQKSFAPGKWENTAGHVQAGEDPADAILRELWEETGIRAAKENLVLLGNAKLDHYLGKNYGLRLTERPQRLTLQPGETDDAKWVTPEELAAMDKSGELAPSILEHLKSGYLAPFLKFIGRESGLFEREETL